MKPKSKYEEMFRDRLLERMQELDMTTVELSVRTGISRTAFGRYYKGTTVPDALRLRKIADALNVDADWLIGLRDTSPLVRDAGRRW